MTLDTLTEPKQESGAPDDAALVSVVQETLAAPRTERSSFTLHAPLEMLARVELLDMVDDPSHAHATARIAALGRAYLRAGDAVPAAEPVSFGSPHAATSALLSAVGDGDPDASDSAATWLADNLSPDQIAEALAGPLLYVFGAAAHAPILFAAWLRNPTADPRPLRGIARSLAASPRHVLAPERVSPPDRPAGTPADLGRALSELVKVKDPDWGIYGMVRNADTVGVMATLPAVADGDIDAALDVVLRVAARSMLDDDPANGPYGWTHCLTIPLAVRQTAHLHGQQRVALDLATMLVAAARVGSGAAPLTSGSLSSTTRHDFAALASAASVRHDAHLAKYVLACHHASGLDPEAVGLYLEAAGRLLQWWKDNPAPEDQL